METARCWREMQWTIAELLGSAEEWNPPSLALCPATNTRVSTSENCSDLTHYAPPWNYNPESKRGSRNPVSWEIAMQELLNVIKSTKPDNFTPRVVEQKGDYFPVEYECPILGFVDDVQFRFPPGKKPIVEYRSASCLGKKRIKSLRQASEKKGWAFFLGNSLAEFLVTSC